MSYFRYVHVIFKMINLDIAYYCSGYMSPEYAMVGHFSAKSDVFSFGVLCLEIISGRKNNSHNDQEKSQHLAGYVSTNIYMLLKSRNHLYYFTVVLDISLSHGWKYCK